MRIIHVIDYFQPKLGYQETFLAREQSEAGHDVFVVTSDRYHPFLYTGNVNPIMGERIRGTGFSLENGVQVWRLKTLLELPNLVWLSGLEKKIREIKPDLVIVHGVTSITAVRVALVKNRNTVFKLIYDDHAIPDNTTGKMRILYPLFKWTLARLIQKAADSFVAILPATREFMHIKYGIPLERIRVIPLGADINMFRRDETARQEIRRKLKFTDADIVFIYTGKIIPFRQVNVFVDAISGLSKEFPNIIALFVGTGEKLYTDQLKNEIESKGLNERFIWLDAVANDQLYRYYSAADVSVWPFGASIGMREAMACGLPIIIGEKSLVTELVEYENGLLLKESNTISLMEQMKKLMEPELRMKMGNSSRRLVEEKFSWKAIAGQFLTLVSPNG